MYRRMYYILFNKNIMLTNMHLVLYVFISFVLLSCFGVDNNKDNEDSMDAIIQLIMMENDFNGLQEDQNEELMNNGIELSQSNGVWVCGKCSDYIDESKLLYSEVNELDNNMDNHPVLMQVSIAQEGMHCVTVSTDSKGAAIRRVAGACSGTTVTISVENARLFTVKKSLYGKQGVSAMSATVAASYLQNFGCEKHDGSRDRFDMGIVQEAEETNYTSVTEYFAGKSIFITGGTGFLGKVIMEKLLFSCKGINKIYVLVRANKNATAKQRMKQLTDNVLFSRLSQMDFEKIIPIDGDLTAPTLGIKPKDEDMIINEVSIVIHSAATVKLNEPLSTALSINVEGTSKVLSLCRRMKNIKVLVHLSTAYTNTNLETVEEIVYPPPAKLKDVYKHLENHGDDKAQTALILNGRPNTYTFTKALAETLVSERHGSVPTIIIRPSIVTSTYYNEPIEGWLDNWNGATGILASICSGLLRVLIGNGNNKIDLIPADMVANLTIVSAARCRRSNSVTVYNICTSASNPITIRQLIDYFVKESINNRYDGIPFPMVIFTKFRFIFWIISIFFELLPAYILDFINLMRGKNLFFVKVHDKIKLLRSTLEYFTSRSWDIRSERALALAASLSAADQQQFPCAPTDIIWSTYIYNYCKGVSRHLLKKQN